MNLLIGFGAVLMLSTKNSLPQITQMMTLISADLRDLRTILRNLRELKSLNRITAAQECNHACAPTLTPSAIAFGVGTKLWRKRPKPWRRARRNESSIGIPQLAIKKPPIRGSVVQLGVILYQLPPGKRGRFFFELKTSRFGVGDTE
jgi:hypothetical protein